MLHPFHRVQLRDYKKNRLLIHTATWINLKGTMLSEGGKANFKILHTMIPFNSIHLELTELLRWRAD